LISRVLHSDLMILLAARYRWREIGSPAGAIPALHPPGDNSGFTPRMDAVPALGEHTDAILRELGISDAEIVALRAAGVIGAASSH
jgi:itaconate CoA-transferase